ncbi:hypothetical protein CDL15_Pgr024094 [Punica granatum]|uniref:GH18 domain-containing protein n=1 Tax=Punica granatum TaxID=22663 RepID=A0A218XXI5_PUNGR|nr:hypothetical protein CDL15_Pgr024094 [Punica granatum]
MQSSITRMVREFDSDGIDIDYEHFKASPKVFAQCIGQFRTLLLKKDKVISFALIAPYDSGPAQDLYQALWKKYGHLIDYVNFQFYDSNSMNTIGLGSRSSGGISTNRPITTTGEYSCEFSEWGKKSRAPPFYEARKELKGQGKLGGIFVWCAEESVKSRFHYEKKSRELAS